MSKKSNESEIVISESLKLFSLELSNQLSKDFNKSIICYPMESFEEKFVLFQKSIKNESYFLYSKYNSIQTLCSFQRNILAFLAADILDVDPKLLMKKQQISIVEQFVSTYIAKFLKKFFESQDHIFEYEEYLSNINILHIAYSDDLIMYYNIPFKIDDKLLGYLKLCVV